MNTETALVIPTYDGLEIESQTSLATAFSPFFATAEKWRQQALTIKVTDATQKREMKLARESRLALKEARVAVEKKRKALKADIILKGKAIDGCANIFNAAVEPIENYLLEQETFAERIEKARIEAEQAALRQSRSAELLALGYAHAGADLGAMLTLDYANVLADAKAIKAEQDKAAADAKAREEERLRLKAENERLQREAAEAKRLADEERKRVAAEAAAVAKERDRVADMQRKISEADAKAATELLRAEHNRLQAIANAEADALAAKLEGERRAWKTAEAALKATQQAEAARLARKAEDARLAAIAPEREKLLAFAASLRDLPVPDVEMATTIRLEVANMAKWVEELMP